MGDVFKDEERCPSPRHVYVYILVISIHWKIVGKRGRALFIKSKTTKKNVGLKWSKNRRKMPGVQVRCYTLSDSCLGGIKQKRLPPGETAVLVTILNLRFFYDYTYSVSLDYHRIRVQIYGFFQYNKNNCVFLFLKNLQACFFSVFSIAGVFLSSSGWVATVSYLFGMGWLTFKRHLNLIKPYSNPNQTLFE